MQLLRVFSLLVFGLWLPLAAQSDRATVTGRVYDPSGASIAGARVTALNQATGVRYTATTTSVGNYVIQQVPVGTYELTVEAAGFRRHVHRGIGVNVAQTVTVDATLEVGQVEQVIEVSAMAARLEVSNSDMGTVVSRERVVDLPLAVSGNMRHPGAFVFLTPGVTGDVNNTQINGSQSRAKEVLLDGIGSTSPESGGILFTYPSVEAISEFKLLSAVFNAEYGRTGGGFEIYTTKSGTNLLHGNVFNYLRNDRFDSRGFFARSRPVNRQNEFGASLGGPVLIPRLYNGKNRSFFYTVYSGFRFRAGAINELTSIPSLAFRQGDFSNLVNISNNLVRVYDPATTRPDAGGHTRDPFPNNRIPSSRFSAVSRNIIPLLPQPSTDGVLNNFFTVGAQRFDRDQLTVKVDHSLSERNRLSLFTYIGTQTNIDPERLPGPFTSSLDRDRRSRWVRLSHDYIVSPSSLNHFSIGFTREGEYWSKLSADQDWPNQIGLKGVNTGPGNVFPRVTFTDGFATWADDSKNVGAQVNNAWQITESFSHVRGKHSYKIGGEARWLQTNGADPFNQQGSFAFNSLGTALPTPAARASTGNAFASFLLGQVHSSDMNALFVVPGNRYRYLALYAQDDWKVTRRLTLNYGVRYEIYLPRIERFDNMSGFDPALPNPAAGNLPGAILFLGEGPGRDNSRRSFADTYYRNWGPRFGFAYSLSSKTVLRGGYGIFYAPGNATAGLRSSQIFTVGFNAAPSYASRDTGVTPAFNWDAGFPTDWPKPPFINPAVANGTNIRYMGRADGRPPYFQNWSFNIQRELPGNILADIAYVGTKGTRLGTSLINSMNQVDPRHLSLGALLSRPANSPEAAAAGIRVPFPGFSGSVAQALRPYPQYLNIERRSDPNGNSTYHALQAKAEKRFTAGLTFLAAYTWAKSLSDGDIMAGGGPGGQDFYNRRLEKAISTNDVPHVFALSYLWDLPFGPGRRFLTGSGVMSKLIGGWTFTAIHQHQASRPITLTANNTLPLFNGVLRPDVLQGVARQNSVDRFDPARDRRINPAAFANPAPLRFGTSARAFTDLTSFPLHNESFGLIKRTELAERFTLQFRAEFFNVFNRTVFGTPAGNASNANFGLVSSQANTPRQGQVALRLEF